MMVKVVVAVAVVEFNNNILLSAMSSSIFSRCKDSSLLCLGVSSSDDAHTVDIPHHHTSRTVLQSGCWPA